MNRIKNWALTLGLASSLLAGVANPRIAVALSESEVMSRLEGVPVFTLADDKGNAIGVTTKDAQQKDKPVLFFFLDHNEVLQQLAFFQKENPAEAKKVGIQLWSMKDLVESIQNLKGEHPIYSIRPNNAQMKTALDLLKASGQIVEKDGNLLTKSGEAFVPDIPLFYPSFVDPKGVVRPLEMVEERTVDGKKQTSTYVPVYMSKADMDRAVAQLIEKSDQSKVKTSVMMLNGFLNSLYNAKTPEEVILRLIPSTESSQFANSILQQSSKQSPTAPQEK